MYILIAFFILCNVIITVVEIESLKAKITGEDLTIQYEKGDY